MKVSDIKIGTKLYLSFFIVIALFSLLLGTIFFEMNTMKNLEDESAQRSQDAVEVVKTGMLVDETYGVISDSVISLKLKESEKNFAQIKNEIKTAVKKIHDIADTTDEKSWVKQIDKDFKILVELYEKEMLPLLKTGNTDPVKVRQINEKIHKTSETLTVLIDDKFYPSIKKEMNEAAEKFDSTYNQIIILSLILAAVAIVIAFAFSFIITRYIKNHLNMVVDLTGKIAEGDLTGRISLNQGDEFGMLADALNMSMENLNEMMSSVKTGTSSLTQVVQEIASGNENLSQRTSEQASSLEEIASTIEQATAAINQNADNANTAKNTTDDTMTLAQEGGTIISNTVSAISELSESSNKIAEIITVINDIAFQTNLLALNAAVEAARAGEQGRGFAVVAGEVRNLAQRTGNSAKEVEELIKDSLEKVTRGTELSSKSGEALERILESLSNVSISVSEINASSHEQKQGINQINNAIAELDNMTQQNASLVEETASASEEMSNQSEELLNMVEKFKVDQSISSEVSGNTKSMNSVLAIKDNGNGNGNGRKHKNKIDDGMHTSAVVGKSAAEASQSRQQQNKQTGIKEIMKEEGFEEF